MNSRLLIALLLGAVAASALTLPKSKFLSRAVTGNDGRHDEYRAKKDWKEYGHSTALLIWRGDLKWHSDETYSFTNVNTLEDVGVCPNERFSTQPSNGICTAFLASENQVVTHSSCFQVVSCEDSRFVFGYDVTEPGVSKERFFRTDVYKCASTVTAWEDGYTVVTLDRPVKGRKPLPISERYAVRGENLATVGHPVGLPRKYAGNAKVLYNVEDDPSLTWFYYTDLDIFWGDSGSPVISRDTGEVVGILWTRGLGYVYDDNKGCLVAKHCFSIADEPDCFGGLAVVPLGIHALLNHQCKADKDCSGHGTCSEGTCQCEPGYFGSNCGYWDNNVCQGHGTLVNIGQCVCNPGYKGQFCEETDPDAVLITARAYDNTGFFGFAVSGDGPRVAIGQPICLDESAGCTGGHIEVFDITEAGFVSSAVLSSPYPFNSACGIYVQLRGDVLLFSCVAFPIGDNQYSATVQAAVYDHENNVWNYDVTLVAPADQGADPLESSFGAPFAFQDIVAVGAPGAVNDGVKSGAVFLYVPSDDPNWSTSPIKISLPGVGDDKFGSGVALDGPYLAISNDPSSYARSVTLYFLADDIYYVTQLQTKTSAAFGFSIAINANVYTKEANPSETAILVVGEPGFTHPIAVEGGAVHIYDITNPYNVFLSQTLLSQITADQTYFGARVVARGGGVGVFYGAASDNPAPFGGLDVYVTPNGNKFELGASKRTNFLPPGSAFGHAIDFNEYGTIVGAPLTYINGPANGAAVAFGW